MFSLVRLATRTTHIPRFTKTSYSTVSFKIDEFLKTQNVEVAKVCPKEAKMNEEILKLIKKDLKKPASEGLNMYTKVIIDGYACTELKHSSSNEIFALSVDAINEMERNQQESEISKSVNQIQMEAMNLESKLKFWGHTCVHRKESYPIQIVWCQKTPCSKLKD